MKVKEGRSLYISATEVMIWTGWLWYKSW